MISKRFPHRLSAPPSPSIFFLIIISFNHSALHHVLMTLAAEKQHGPTGLLIMRYTLRPLVKFPLAWRPLPGFAIGSR